MLSPLDTDCLHSKYHNFVTVRIKIRNCVQHTLRPLFVASGQVRLILHTS